MAEDYISRQAAIDAIPKPQVCEYMDEFGAGRNSCAYDAEKAIEALPAADDVPVVHGKWIPHSEKSREYIGTVLVHVMYDYWLCDTCGYRVENGQPTYNFCPNCGAKMDGKGEE